MEMCGGGCDVLAVSYGVRLLLRSVRYLLYEFGKLLGLGLVELCGVFL